MSSTWKGDEIIGKVWSEDWDREMPITLVTYSDGEQDVHWQTGSHWDEAMVLADKLLKERGLYRTQGNDGMIGPSGVYMAVEKI